ncbi:hypothetical protein M514_24991, partial [Trichuris suis]
DHKILDQICRTVFIPKKSQVRGPSDYRPIAIASVFYRLFTKIVANRLSRMVQLNCRQKGFTKKTDGCGENTFMLNAALTLSLDEDDKSPQEKLRYTAAKTVQIIHWTNFTRGDQVTDATLGESYGLSSTVKILLTLRTHFLSALKICLTGTTCRTDGSVLSWACQKTEAEKVFSPRLERGLTVRIFFKSGLSLRSILGGDKAKVFNH